MRVFTRWDEVSTTVETNELLLQLARVHLSRISDPGLKVVFSDLLDREDIIGLCSYEIRYDDISVNDAINVRQILAFFSKRHDLTVGVDKREAAVRTFIASEDLCRETNRIFQSRRENNFYMLSRVEPMLHRAQHKIAYILGDVPSLSDLKIRFGPGATTQVKRRMASARRKLSVLPACSEDMAPIVSECLSEMPGFVFDSVEDVDCETKMVTVQIHDGNLVFVPKNAKTERSVVIEPSLNTMFQAGIGTYMAQCLRSVGIDVRDQSRNKRAAREGSISGELATLDLSSASDTVARELVFDLLPIDWYLFLTSFRTSHVQYEGVRLHMEKFSSMGNGFTFPLETLIFYALACACVLDEDIDLVSVYGDDIIVPTYAYDDLCFLLRCCGFIPNTAKSFATGPFRESCGGDYLRGIDIRPCYIKGPLAGNDLFRLHNFYARGLDPELASTIVDFIAPHIRLWGPDGYGDGHLLGDHTLEPHQRKSGWSGYVFETYSFRPRKELATLPGDRVYPCYTSYVSGHKDQVAERRNIPSSALQHLKEILRDELAIIGSSPPHKYNRGLLVTPLPGVKSYNRIKIYVLA